MFLSNLEKFEWKQKPMLEFSGCVNDSTNRPWLHFRLDPLGAASFIALELFANLFQFATRWTVWCLHTSHRRGAISQ